MLTTIHYSVPGFEHTTTQLWVHCLNTGPWLLAYQPDIFDHFLVASFSETNAFGKHLISFSKLKRELSKSWANMMKNLSNLFYPYQTSLNKRHSIVSASFGFAFGELFSRSNSIDLRCKTLQKNNRKRILWWTLKLQILFLWWMSLVTKQRWKFRMHSQANKHFREQN